MAELRVRTPSGPSITITASLKGERSSCHLSSKTRKLTNLKCSLVRPSVRSISSSNEASAPSKVQPAAVVAEQRGIDVLVGRGVALDSRHVQPALMRECAAADVRLARERRDVGEFVH